MKTLKAYTIIEVLIAMAISSLIISFSYAALHIVTKQLFLYKNTTGQIKQAVTLQQVLGADFDRCEFAAIDGNSIKLSNKNGRIITYFFDQFISRNIGEVTDTFFIYAKDLETKSYNVSIQNPDSSLINEISFKIDVISTEQQLHFVKVYPAETLLNFTPVKN